MTSSYQLHDYCNLCALEVRIYGKFTAFKRKSCSLPALLALPDERRDHSDESKNELDFWDGWPGTSFSGYSQQVSYKAWSSNWAVEELWLNVLSFPKVWNDLHGATAAWLASAPRFVHQDPACESKEQTERNGGITCSYLFTYTLHELDLTCIFVFCVSNTD